jgi:hypothetical protein
MPHKTNGVRLLDQLGVPYELRAYDVDPDDLAAETFTFQLTCAVILMAVCASDESVSINRFELSPLILILAQTHFRKSFIPHVYGKRTIIPVSWPGPTHHTRSQTTHANRSPPITLPQPPPSLP